MVWMCTGMHGRAAPIGQLSMRAEVRATASMKMSSSNGILIAMLAAPVTASELQAMGVAVAAVRR